MSWEPRTVCFFRGRPARSSTIKEKTVRRRNVCPTMAVTVVIAGSVRTNRSLPTSNEQQYSSASASAVTDESMNPSGYRIDEEKKLDAPTTPNSFSTSTGGYKSTHSSRSSVLERAREYNRRVEKQQDVERQRSRSLEQRSRSSSRTQTATTATTTSHQQNHHKGTPRNNNNSNNSNNNNSRASYNSASASSAASGDHRQRPVDTALVSRVIRPVEPFLRNVSARTWAP